MTLPCQIIFCLLIKKPLRSCITPGLTTWILRYISLRAQVMLLLKLVVPTPALPVPILFLILLSPLSLYGGHLDCRQFKLVPRMSVLQWGL